MEKHKLKDSGTASNPFVYEVHIEDRNHMVYIEGAGEEIYLSASEALDLLAWLYANQDELQRIAQEQEKHV